MNNYTPKIRITQKNEKKNPRNIKVTKTKF